MIQIDIPGFKSLELNHLIFDFNGSLGLDGTLLAGVAEELNRLALHLEVHVVTADNTETVPDVLGGIDCRILILEGEKLDVQKAAYVESLGPCNCMVIGNGRNDRLMLQKAALGVAVIGPEGAAVSALFAADVVVTDILDAIDLIRIPSRLIALLRN
ncbi:MAG TPA: ATPase P [Bacteroidales bacterium]|nr:MAG: hypothetical protein A2X11_07500 [Bacteroidetes bacterium GWE2_42_24]OFY29498.1 MAG: hypothetical protein A2X09_04100 [Bacteroidetes bacterium GWF2_43_11]HAQ64697.1 ATPase P [Bacteroidales bacterium]HBZ67293.1 ATPase P [Bacteroidales bacterium]